MTQSTYHGLRRQGTDCTKGSETQEVVSSPALPFSFYSTFVCRRKYGTPEIFNTDQGSQFTSEAFTGILNGNGISISMDGRGRWVDNVFVERLWRSVKYEDIYLRAYGSLTEARHGLAAYFEFYNSRRRHQGLDDRTPDEVYFTTLPQMQVAA